MIKGAILVSPKFFISFILIIIIVCVVLIIVQPGAQINKGGDPKDLPANYFDRKPDWGDSTGQVKKIRTTVDGGICILPLTDTDTCSVYTYVNEFAIEVKPSLNRVFDDLYNGLVFRSNIENISCIDTNQIVAKNATHTCNSKIPNTCINSYGNYVSYGVSEDYTDSCPGTLPACPGSNYSISCNFQLSAYDSLNINSKFLAINNLVTSKGDYEKLEKEDGHYFQEGYFIEDPSGGTSGVFAPNFYNTMYQSASARQQFKIIRYSYDGDSEAWSESVAGPFAKIIFQPANAYLTADKDYNIIMKTVTDINDDGAIQWLMVPPLNLDPGQFPVIDKFTAGNIKNLSSEAECYGKVTKNNLNYFDPAYVFPSYQDIKKGDLRVEFPLKANFSNFFQYWADGTTDKALFPDTSKYPTNVFRALKGGQASDQADFKNIDLSAINYAWIDMGTCGRDTDFERTTNYLDINVVAATLLNKIYSTSSDTSGYDDDSVRINITISTTPIADFSYGNIFQDGEVVWESLDPYQLIAPFEADYFTAGSQLPAATQITTQITTGGTTAAVTYIKPASGLVIKIDTSDLNYSYTEFSEGVKQLPLNNNTTTLGITPSSDNAVISLIFAKSQDTNGNSVVAIADIIVDDPGSNYTDTSFDIFSTALGASASASNITNLKLTTDEQKVLYTAVSIGTDNNPYTILNPNIPFKQGGLQIPTDEVTITNGEFSLNPSPLAIGVSTGGQGYNVNDLVYINQLDQYGNSVFGASFNPENLTEPNMKKLATVQVTATAVPQPSASTSAKHSLVRAGLSFNDSDTNSTPVYSTTADSIPLDTNAIQYNYYNNSPGKYESSPPQIAFVGDGTIDNLKNIIKEGSAEELTSYFFAEKKSPDSFYTGVENIKTIQFTDLNYIGSDIGDIDTNVVKNNSLGENIQPVLGRFIPYTAFQPPKRLKINSKKYYVPGKGSFVENIYLPGPATVPGDYIYYNNNYTQLVPTGIDNIYNSAIDSQNLPTV